MNTLRRTAVAIGIALTGATAMAPVHAAPLPEWYGRYVWAEPLGRIGGSGASDGLVAFVTYTLTIRPSRGSTGCTITAEGYQTNKRMQCTATPERNSVVIKYYRFRPAPGGDRYRPGAKLFTMSRTTRGLVTQLQALQPASDATPRSGRLFRPA